MVDKQPPIAVHVLLLTLVVLLSCGGEVESPTLKTGPGLYTVDGEAACSGCEIVLEDVAVLGDSQDSASMREDAAGRSCMVGQLSDAEFVVSGSVGGGRLVFYDGAGPARRTIGRPGQGPGEFGNNLRVWVGAGDSLFVTDDRNARVQVLTSDGQFVRSFQMPARYRPFARLPSGDFLFHRTPSSNSDPMFHLLDASGEVRAAFGQPVLEEVDLESWLVSPSRAGGFWTASMWQYELYEWSSPDSLERTVRRRADWFPGGVWYSDTLYERDPPGPHLIHMWEDESGLLWVYSGVADSDWEPNEMRVPDPDWHRDNFDVVIEVIDLRQERVVATRTIDFMLGAVCGSPLMYAVEYSDVGDTRTRVVRPRLLGYDG